VFRSLEEMQTSAARAAHVPAQQAAFRQLYLNEWRDGSAAPWLDLAIWDEGAIDPGEISLGARCWIGVDLASTSDLAAVVAVFEGIGGRYRSMGDCRLVGSAGPPLDDGEGYQAISRFYCPQDGIRRRSERDGVPYAMWAEQGYLTATRGSVIDYDVILADIVDLAEKYRATVVLDRWNSTATISRLQELGIECVTFGQGFASMSGAMKETERLILSRQLKHNGNPVLRWNVGNVDVAQDPAGNIKPDRARSREKIDGLVALIMAIGVAAGSGSRSVYEERPSFLVI
jgi:phage terminase large subunit-like protein